ncbi:Ubiquitin carboxyl-terminal hydrolase 6 [Vitis vinifera]|uniref:ubiquitinyl hydrolase 1 n=1 Tax=Vitis vinifera TaxID=29760 RepID=A0A438EVX9_VITVI|nr:Ubiquitin carboxyl-terminal hydrolase 6 [Vitis vinifera]
MMLSCSIRCFLFFPTSLSSFNRTLLCKWCWSFVDERGALWKQVISGKYRVEEGGCSYEVRERVRFGRISGVETILWLAQDWAWLHGISKTMTSDWPVLGLLMENLKEKVRNYTRVSQCIPPTNKWSNRSREPLFGKLVVSSGASIYLQVGFFTWEVSWERLKHWIRLRGGGGFTTMKNKSLTTFYFIVKRLGFFYSYFLFLWCVLGLSLYDYHFNGLLNFSSNWFESAGGKPAIWNCGPPAFRICRLLKGLKSELEKASPSLGRSAIYVKESRINGLPRYLTIQFVRFFWKRESNQKAKILRILRDEEGKKLGLKNSASKDNDVKMADAEGSSNRSGESSLATSDEGVPTDKETHLTGIYDLVAVLTHKGRSADSGHYVAWVKQESGKWIEFDDDNPIPQREEDITKLSGGGDWHMAYICMYKARTIPIFKLRLTLVVHGPGLNPTTDDTLNLPGTGCCGAVSTLRFESLWRVLRAWPWKLWATPPPPPPPRPPPPAPAPAPSIISPPIWKDDTSFATNSFEKSMTYGPLAMQ